MDELITQAISRKRPTFDFDKWQKEHPSEIETYQSQAGRICKSTRPLDIWKIVMKSKITKLAAAAVIIGAILIGLNVNGTSALAQMVRALSEVENIHIDSGYSLSIWNGQVQRHQYWLRKPNYYREAKANGDIIIDNGSRRLTIYTNKKQAQLAESWQAFHPLAEEQTFHFAYLLRDHNIMEKFKSEIEISPLPAESNDTTLVYKIDNWSGLAPEEGRLWADAKTMLPLRVRAHVKKDTGERKYESDIKYEFNYDRIPDEFFSTAIPEGFTELPQIKPFTLSGKVIDEHRQPVSGAVVYATFESSIYVLNDVTQTDGTFALKPVTKKDQIELPIFIRAFRPDDTSHVAWTFLRDPEDRRTKLELLGTIAGDPGKIEFVTDGEGRRVFTGAEEIVLKMEPASAITGTVTDDEGNPIPNVAVTIEGELSQKDRSRSDSYEINFGDPDDLWRWRVNTDKQGKYTFTNLPQLWEKCIFSLHLEKEGYWSKYDGFANDGPFQTQTVDVQLFRKNLVTVTGRVVDNHGASVVCCRVYNFAHGKDWDITTKTVTDEQGYFKLENCRAAPDLKIKIRALSEHEWDFDRKKYNIDADEFVYYPRTQVPIDYKPGKKKYHVEITPERPDITIEVVVADSAGKAIPGHKVRLRAGANRSFYWKEETATDENGRVVFTEVPREEDVSMKVAGGGKFEQVRMPVELIPGKKEYKIEVILLTEEEYKSRKEDQ